MKGGAPCRASRPDAELVRQIRKAMLASESLTRRAHQLIVIAEQGIVIPSGTVGNVADRSGLETLAHRSGALRDDNRIEVDDEFAEGQRAQLRLGSSVLRCRIARACAPRRGSSPCFART
jgi:hypothetical protein